LLLQNDKLQVVNALQNWAKMPTLKMRKFSLVLPQNNLNVFNEFSEFFLEMFFVAAAVAQNDELILKIQDQWTIVQNFFIFMLSCAKLVCLTMTNIYTLI